MSTAEQEAGYGGGIKAGQSEVVQAARDARFRLRRNNWQQSTSPEPATTSDSGRRYGPANLLSICRRNSIPRRITLLSGFAASRTSSVSTS